MADVRFVLDQLAAIAAGRNPDADRHPLPVNLARVLDLSKVGIYGHSRGGATSLQVLHDDARVRAAVDLDGSLHGSLPTESVPRPVLLIRSARPPDPGRQLFWTHDRGPELQFPIPGTRHMSFTDWSVIMPQLAAAGLTTREKAVSWAGDIPAGALAVQLNALRLFFAVTLD